MIKHSTIHRRGLNKNRKQFKRSFYPEGCKNEQRYVKGEKSTFGRDNYSEAIKIELILHGMFSFVITSMASVHLLFLMIGNGSKLHSIDHCMPTIVSFTLLHPAATRKD